ncbi:PAS domain S-box protein [bacterium]|nr:PAS domain S-box protein [bacterium]
MNTLSKSNILLVDDNSVDLMVLETILNTQDVRIIKAGSAEEALDKIEGIELALAILDVQMPQTSGIELAKQIRKKEGRQILPLIFLTAYYSDNFHVIEGYGAGAVDYLFKPVDPTILLSKIRVFLNMDKQRRLLIDNKKRLGESKERLQAIYENIPGGIMIIGNDYIIRDVNEVTCQITGYRKEELVGQLCDKVCPKGSASKECPVWVHHQKEFRGMDTAIKCSDGRNKPILKNAKRIPYNGELYILEIFEDISGLKQVEKALIESENMYRTLLDASPEGILIINLSGHISEVSGITPEIFGTESKQELIKKHFLRFVHAESRGKVRNVIEKTMIEGLDQDVEFFLTKIDGKQFVGEVSTTLIQEANGMPRSFMAIVRDISQRKEIEKQLIHTERMAGLGEMATGIAHEINQPLNTISMTLDNILLRISDDKKIENNYLTRKVNKMFESIYRISKIIDHIRAFSRDHDDIPSAFDINESIRNALSMISAQCKHRGIDLITHLSNNLPSIFGNTFKFEQVILNLVINAKDALEERKLQENFDKEIRIQTFQDEHHILVEVTDNGIGIKKEDLGNVMLPFYSTKEEGKGTGMGLAISFGIIKEMKGNIDIRSEVSRGTLVRISLPK